MASCVDLSRPLADALGAVARKQVSKVRQGVRDPAAVHDTRKALKRLRAWLQLVARPDRDRRARRLDRTLRDLGRALSGARDAQVMAGHWERLRTMADLGGDAALPAPPTAAHPTDGTARMPPMKLLTAAERDLARLDLERVSMRQLLRGAARAYRDGRRWRRIAIEADTSEQYHEWRKRVQRHWRHMQLLGDVWPEEFAARVEVARTLSAVIGEEHDLALLAAHLERSEGATSNDSRTRALVAIQQRRAGLRIDARRLGYRLYAEKPKAFSRRLVAYAATRDQTAIAQMSSPEAVLETSTSRRQRQ